MTRKYRPAVAYPRDLAQEDEHFNSAINDKGEIRGVVGSGRHVGITASVMRPGMLRELAIGRHSLTRLFVDSGAFAEVDRKDVFKIVKPITHVVWKKRLKLYRWAAATYRDRAYLVAPDQVANQVVTMERMRRYALDIAFCASYGAQIIVPVQKGAMPMGEFYALAVTALCLRFDQAIAGIPMMKDATSLAELREFCEALPWFGARIHLLGIGPKARGGRFWKAIDAIKSVRPNCKVTSDSALVIGIVGSSNGPKGTPRIYTKLQAEARAKGMKGSDAKEYALMGEGFAKLDANRVRAEDAGWFDEELYDSAEEARAHRLSGFHDPEEQVAVEIMLESFSASLSSPSAPPRGIELQLVDRDTTVTTYQICF